jgi:uncharacterized protein (DUF2252 family)
MDVRTATTAYEAWLGKQIPLLPADLKLKHQRMIEGVFPFLRATFYRWAQLWPDNCPELANAPVTLAVGDLHIENFGTWRDSEGRLIWGVNDFDEACELPYAVDLLRLAVSALLATSEGTTSCTPLTRARRSWMATPKASTAMENHSCWRSFIMGCAPLRSVTSAIRSGSGTR